MPVAIVLAVSSLVTLIAVIGLVDAFTHLFAGLLRALAAPRTIRAASLPIGQRGLAS